jgi:hypothetical protein
MTRTDLPVALTALPVFQGPAWRCPTGHAPEGSAADVVRYEQEELGNDLGVSPALLAALAELPARRLCWATRTAEQARRYGDAPKRLSLPAQPHLLADIGVEGVLLII